MMIDRERCAVTGSSTRLVSEPTPVSSTTGRLVPAGIVTSRQTGAGAAGGAAAGAAGLVASAPWPAVATPPLVSGLEAGLDGVPSASPLVDGSAPLHPPIATLSVRIPNVISRMKTSGFERA